MNSFHWLRAFLILLATCAVVVLFSTQADACGQGKGKHSMPTYAEIDVDGDERVTAEEFYGFRAQRMAARAAEGRKMKNAKNAPTFEELDLDGDGSLSADEFAKHQAQCPMKKQGGKHEH